jgi:hypothetical protein
MVAGLLFDVVLQSKVDVMRPRTFFVLSEHSLITFQEMLQVQPIM